MDDFSILTLGPPGSFSHQAALYFARRLDIDDIQFGQSNAEVVRRTLESLDSYFGVIPFETTGGGLVPEVISELISNLGKKPKFYGEYGMPIEQCLASKNDLSGVRKIVTHQQSILQCRIYLEQLKQEYSIEVEAVESNSKAAILASQDDRIAAICPRLAAELYNLPYVVYGIQDSKSNETRFIIVHDKDHETPTGNDRTTLTYKVENKSAALYNAIGAFSRRGLNLSGQHSLPTRLRLGDYSMLTEIEAHRSDDIMQKALRELDDWVVHGSVYILGSYSRANAINSISDKL